MRVTKEQLRRIIREAVKARLERLNEAKEEDPAQWPDLEEAAPRTSK
jgi:hypothetical protein